MTPAAPLAADFLASSPLFRKACELAHIPPTKRQARKWLTHRGAAWERRHDASAELQREKEAAR